MVSFFHNFIDSVPVFIRGLSLTLQITVWTILLAVVLGAIIAGLRMSRFASLRAVARAYLAIIRGTPLITQLFVIYFGLVAIVKIDSYWAAVIGLTVHSAAYVAEIYRSGVQSVNRGQVEAARSLGMSQTLSMRIVIAPQALRTVLPALANQFIIALKDTAVASFITVDELFQQAQKLSAAKFEPLQFYVIVGVYYFVVVMVLTQLVGLLERRLRTSS